MLSLDIGCSVKPKGSVNVDSRKIAELKRSTNGINIPNFVQCSASQLPFRDKVFDTALCMNILEHLQHPKYAINEASRVAYSVKIRQDTLINPINWLHPEHKYITFRLFATVYFIRRPKILNFICNKIIKAKDERDWILKEWLLRRTFTFDI